MPFLIFVMTLGPMDSNIPLAVLLSVLTELAVVTFVPASPVVADLVSSNGRWSGIS